MRMHNPPHPGEVLKELCIEPLNIAVDKVAEALGISHRTLSVILSRRASISPEIAIQLGKASDTSAESWLNQQMQYDLASYPMRYQHTHRSRHSKELR